MARAAAGGEAQRKPVLEVARACAGGRGAFGGIYLCGGIVHEGLGESPHGEDEKRIFFSRGLSRLYRFVPFCALCGFFFHLKG